MGKTNKKEHGQAEAARVLLERIVGTSREPNQTWTAVHRIPGEPAGVDGWRMDLWFGPSKVAVFTNEEPQGKDSKVARAWFPGVESDEQWDDLMMALAAKESGRQLTLDEQRRVGALANAQAPRLTVPVGLEDHRAQFRDLVASLRGAAGRFDSGGPDAERRHAKEIAGHLRTLLHDGAGESVSVLERLGIKGGLVFHDTSSVPDTPEIVEVDGRRFVKQSSMDTGGMVGLSLGGRDTVYRANLGPPLSKRPFEEWWSRTVLIIPGATYSRRDAVKTMADKEVAHVDAAIPEKYHTLTRANTLGMEIAVGGKKIEWDEAMGPALVRQVAHEVLATLDERDVLADAAQDRSELT